MDILERKVRPEYVIKLAKPYSGMSKISEQLNLSPLFDHNFLDDGSIDA